jgi:hypothetical protein
MFIRRGARKLCDVCASVWDANRQAMIAEAMQRAKTASELKLSGSKKQIEWADRIRERWLFNVQWDVSSHLIGTNVERATEAVSTQKQAIAVQQACTNVLALRLAAIDEVLSHAVAAWWIDWRFQLMTGSAGRRTLRSSLNSSRCWPADLASRRHHRAAMAVRLPIMGVTKRRAPHRFAYLNALRRSLTWHPKAIRSRSPERSLRHPSREPDEAEDVGRLVPL